MNTDHPATPNPHDDGPTAASHTMDLAADVLGPIADAAVAHRRGLENGGFSAGAADAMAADAHAWALDHWHHVLHDTDDDQDDEPTPATVLLKALTAWAQWGVTVDETDDAFGFTLDPHQVRALMEHAGLGVSTS